MTRASSRRWASIVGIAALTCCVAAPSAYAQSHPTSEKAATDQRAREMFLKGDAAYAEGRYEEALASFKEAYELSGRPQLLFNISNAAERLGRYAEAVDALEKYLASGKAKDRDVVQKRLTNLRKRVEEQKKEQEKQAREEEERKKREEAERKKNEEALANSLSERDRQRPPPPPPPKPAPVLPWILIGGGGAVFATGAVFGVLTLAARSDVSSRCTSTPTGRLCDQDARSALDREKTFGIIADVGMGVGLIAAGVGTWLLLSGKPAASSNVYVGARPTPGGGGIDVGGRF